MPQGKKITKTMLMRQIAFLSEIDIPRKKQIQEVIKELKYISAGNSKSDHNTGLIIEEFVLNN